jgi:hypothetical protein
MVPCLLKVGSKTIIDHINTVIDYMIVGWTVDPKAPAARIMFACWWIYCITLGAVYSGNLIAFTAVTIERLPFDGIDDVAYQDEYKIGTLGGAIYETWFKVRFEHSVNSVFRSGFSDFDNRPIHNSREEDLHHERDGPRRFEP